MTSFATLTTDINCVINFNKQEFIDTVKSTIDFAINEKEYNINDLDAVFILQDITNRLDVSDFGVSEEVLKCIEEQLSLYN